jgi:hypothetical protein
MKASEAVARNIKAREAALDMSHEDLAKAMNQLGHEDWVARTVTEVEGLRRRVSIDELVSLALVLGYVFGDLLVPPDEQDRLDFGAGTMRPGFVSAWGRGDLVVKITWDEQGKPERNIMARIGAQLDFDAMLTAIELRRED